MLLMLSYTLIYASILMLVAYGGMVSERSGIVNLGLEGIMVIGALSGTLVMRALPGTFPAAFLIVVLASAAAGCLFSLLLAVSAVSFNADQTLVGTAMNMLATAAAAVIARTNNMAADPNDVSANVSFGANKTMLTVPIGSVELNCFFFIALIAMLLFFVIFKKSRFGLRLVACGEHPHAAASVGIAVRKMRYAGVMISGILGGIGGIAYVTASVSEWNFENGVAGFGFLALAVMIFGKWRTFSIALAAVLFGALRAISNVYPSFSFLESLSIPSALYNILPYVICLVILVLFSGKSSAPRSAGIPYTEIQE